MPRWVFTVAGIDAVRRLGYPVPLLTRIQWAVLCRVTARSAHACRLGSSPFPLAIRRFSVSAMADTKQESTGMRVMFWAWIVLIFGGLTVMIALPLLGR